MDIAKYIGLFLLKNNFCYIHGLGNLELKKKPAVYDGNALQAPSYEVLLTPGGSIDDNLANFIATAEQISISKAANALRDYSAQAKVDLNEGKEVVIPSLGKFIVEDNAVTFVTNEGLQKTPAGIQVVKAARVVVEEPVQSAEPEIVATPEPAQEPESEPVPKRRKLFREPKQPVVAEPIAEPQPAPQPEVTEQQELPPVDYPPYPESSGGIRWGRVLLILIAIAIVIAGAIWGIQYINMQETPPSIILPQDTAITPQTVTPADIYQDTAIQPVTDTTTTPGITTPAPAVAVAPVSMVGKEKFSMVINTYWVEDLAKDKVTDLRERGNNASMIRTSAGYQVLMTIMCRPEDTTHVADSLRKVHNPGPKGKVYVYHPEAPAQ